MGHAVQRSICHPCLEQRIHDVSVHCILGSCKNLELAKLLFKITKNQMLIQNKCKVPGAQFTMALSPSGGGQWLGCALRPTKKDTKYNLTWFKGEIIDNDHYQVKQIIR